MRLGLCLLNNGATLNQYQRVPFLSIARGETVTLQFQLVDLDQAGLRYLPSSSATVQFQIPRTLSVLPAANGTRQVIDYSVNRGATMAYPNDDRSIWSIALTATDTTNLVSGSIRATLTDGVSIQIANLNQAIRIIDGQDQ